MTKEQIQTLQQQLAYALSQADKAKAAALVAEKAYDDEFVEVVATFDADHPELVKTKNEAQAAYEQANNKAQAVRAIAQRILGDYFLQPDAEDKPADGFSMRQEKEALYDTPTLLKEAVEQKATCFLMLDEKAIQKFVVANAEKDGNLYQMPDYLRRWMPGLQVTTVQKPLISDKTLVKLAPDKEPEVMEEPDPKPVDANQIPF